MEDVGKFCVHLVYFTAIWYILWLFGIFLCLFGIFLWLFGTPFPFWYVAQRKIWQPLSSRGRK
jgi:hypothetical protein